MDNISKNGLITNIPKITLPVNSMDNAIPEQLSNIRYYMGNVMKPKDVSENIKSKINRDIDPNALMSLLVSMQETIDRLSNQQVRTANDINQSNNLIQDNINNMNGKMNNHISYIHNCASCGHPLEIPENHPIFNCKYCGAVYVIGPTQIYSQF